MRVTYTTYAAGLADGTTWDLQCDELGWLDSASLRGWKWKVPASGSPAREAATYTATVGFVGSKDDANAFLLAADGDTAAGREGRLAVGEWYLRCNVVEGAWASDSDQHLLLTLTFRASEPVWRRETPHVLVASATDSALVTTGLDYAHDYAFDYAGTSTASAAGSFDLATEAAVRITFKGACNSPYVRISSYDRAANATTVNRYGVNSSASASEYIVIDPLNKSSVGESVYRYDRWGNTTNLFGSRLTGAEGSGTYVFERVPAGHVTITWPQLYDVTVTTIEERSRLPWT